MILEEFNEERFKKNMREEGYEEGYSQGISQGIAQGISQGISQGASQKAVEAAVTLIEKYKVNPEDAAKDMGVTVEAVLEKLNKMQASVNSLSGM